jgi:MFS family permease
VQKWNSILQAIYGGATLVISRESTFLVPLRISGLCRVLNILAVAGLFMDRMASRRTPFLLCLVCLIGATALLAIGTNVGLWVAGRILQGASAGTLWAVCLALLTDTVGPAGIGQAVGVIGIPMSIGPVVGPLLGGVVYAHGGYYAVFGLMFAMLGVDVVLRLVMIEKRVAQKWLEAEAVQPETLDVRPESDSPASLTPCPESSDISNTMTRNGDERTNRVPPSSQILHYRLPRIIRLLLSFRMLVSLTGGLLQSSLNVAFDSTLPLIVNELFGWQQTGQGLIFITILLPSLLQPVFGAITDRFQQGRRLLAAGGCLLATPAYVLLRLVTQDTLGQKALLCVLLVIVGLAMAIAMPAIIAEIGAIVADAEKNDPQAIKRSVIATGWSLVNAAYAAGCLIGPLFAGLIRNAAGWQTTTWSLGILSAITGVFMLLCLGGWIGKLRPRAFILWVPK